MKYRKLPLYAQLEQVLADGGPAEMEKARAQAALELFQTQGFQFVTQLLRDLENRAINHLRRGIPDHARQLGRIECIEEIRSSLVALLPDDQQAKVEWMDEEEEAFVSLDKATSGAWTEE